jgi:RNA polymerase sporulation-specific sigma factor
VTDEQLAVRAAAGDELAFRELRNRHRGLILGIAAKRYAPGLTADDFAQESLIAFWDAVESYDHSTGVPFGAFANLVVTRRVDTALKVALREKHRVLSDALSFDQPLAGQDGDDGASLADLVPSRVPSAIEQIHQREEVAAVVDAVARLSPLERESLIGRAVGESYRETEERLGISGMGGTVKSVDNALQRARVKIADALGVERFPLGAAA